MAQKAFSPRQLRQRRRAAGLSREQLAVAVGRSYFSICAYEAGRAIPPLPVLLRIAGALGCELADFLESEEVAVDA